MCGKYILGIKSGFAALVSKTGLESLPISREGKVSHLTFFLFQCD